MLRLLLSLLILSACTTIKTGGDKVYVYGPEHDYTSEELKELAPDIVFTYSRDPHVGKLDKLFAPGNGAIKRVGIVIFESVLQPTRGGIANEDRVFISEAGKQIITERLLQIWDQSFGVIAPQIHYVSSDVMKNSKALHAAAAPVEDFTKTNRTDLGTDDLYFAPKGAKTPVHTTFIPRGLRDLSLALVPAYELVGGPKWSEHHKHLVNQVAIEQNLDAVIAVMSQISWTAARIEKNSGESIPEELVVELKSSVLVPYSRYEERLKKIGEKNAPQINLCYRTYEAKLKAPIVLTVAAEDESFATAQKNVLDPALKAYNDLAQMMIHNMNRDFLKTVP